MNIETLKIPVHELTLGMLVVKLDRPWLETPFILQGFRISSNDELRTLEQYCAYVYVDVNRGVRPPSGSGERVLMNDNYEIVHSSALLHKGGSTQSITSQVSEAAADTTLPDRSVEYLVETTFETELPYAMEAVRLSKNVLKQFMQNVRAGQRLDLEPVREAASALEASTLRNPDPVMLLRGLRSDESFSFRHCVHSAILAIAIARELGLRRQVVHELTMGVLLADIGKLRVPIELLRTNRRLYPRETEIIQRHVGYGVEMARALDGLTSSTIEIISAHHERFNGSGYPEGLSGGEIPLLGRIAGLVDSFDAITSDRAYSEAIPIYEAVQEMYAAEIDVFQRELVEKLILVLGAYPVGSLVELSDGSVALVVALNRQRRLLPSVIRLTDSAKQACTAYTVVDLGENRDSRPQLTVNGILDPGQYGVEQPTSAILTP